MEAVTSHADPNVKCSLSFPPFLMFFPVTLTAEQLQASLPFLLRYRGYRQDTEIGDKRVTEGVAAQMIYLASKLKLNHNLFFCL